MATSSVKNKYTRKMVAPRTKKRPKTRIPFPSSRLAPSWTLQPDSSSQRMSITQQPNDGSTTVRTVGIPPAPAATERLAQMLTACSTVDPTNK